MAPLFAAFSPYDMLVIGVIVLLFFGNRLPSVMRSLGQGVTEFKKGMAGIEDDDSLRKEPPRKLDGGSTASVEQRPASTSEQHPA